MSEFRDAAATVVSLTLSGATSRIGRPAGTQGMRVTQVGRFAKTRDDRGDSSREACETLLSRNEARAVCELDEAARAVIADSDSPSHTTFNPRRADKAANIINDFFEKEHFAGRTVVEFGPGHFSFALLARHLGATVVCVEYDPALAALGRHLGFEVFETNLDVITRDFFGRTFDGLWLKGCLNACRMPDDRSIQTLAAELTGFIRPEGWGWLVPCNKGAAPSGDDQLAFETHRVRVQTTAMVEAGWHGHDFDEATMRRYASAYKNAPHIFTRGLRHEVVVTDG